MLILIDKRLPEEAKRKLSRYGSLVEFASQGITYESISGHPDIFFCPTPCGLVAALNTPLKYLSMLTSRGIRFTVGKVPVGMSYPETVHYNAIVTSQYLIHNISSTDESIQILNPEMEKLHVSQGYTRCNLLAMGENSFITSDRGIQKTLSAKGLEILYVSPEGILLPGFRNGFFGGSCGLHEGSLFISGSLTHFGEGQNVRRFADNHSVEIIELYDGPLVDGGGIFFLDNSDIH